MSGGPLKYADLAARWGVCERQAKRLVKQLGLKPMRLGHRTVRFRPADVDRLEDAVVNPKNQKGKR